jgi:hypothetical protein
MEGVRLGVVVGVGEGETAQAALDNTVSRMIIRRFIFPHYNFT